MEKTILDTKLLVPVDINAVDHFIVTRRDVYSFAENRKL